MESQKRKKERRSYEPDFKAEILKMLISGKKVSEISETFGIAEKRSAVAAAVSLENFIHNEGKGQK
jgi:transposase-like protein